MPQFILLSFCNIPTQTTSPLLCLQISDEEDASISYAPVSLGYPDVVITATGLTSTKEKIFVLFKSRQNSFHVAVLQKDNLSSLYHQELPEVKDGHSILATDDCLYIVSTGTDEVISYNIRDKSLENPRIIWKASDTKTDTHHINSIAEKDGEILISAFGPKAGQLWSTASNGYIYNITVNAFAAEGLYHPHSVTTRNGKIYYSDSHRNSFCTVGQPDSIFDLDGYTRGISWLPNGWVCLATSIGRRVSKSTGLITNSADPGEPAGECSLVIGDIAEPKILRNIDLSWFGPEVYDILVLQGLQSNLLLLSNASQLAERHAIQILSSELLNSNQMIQTLSTQIAAKEQLIAAKEQLIAAKEQVILNMDSQIADIYASRSWRITAPLRAIGAKLKQIKEGKGVASVDQPKSGRS
jgi:hypothetical protein